MDRKSFTEYRLIALWFLLTKDSISFKTFRRIFFTRMRTILRYGLNTPYPHARAWCCPNCVSEVHAKFNKRDSGKVKSGDWDLETESLKGNLRVNPVFARALTRLSENVENWQDSMIFEEEKKRLLGKGKSEEYIKARYSQLDKLRIQVRELKTMPSSRESFGSFEFGGIPVNINRHGRPISSGGGMHRLAMAQYYGLKRIPIEIFVVHKGSVNMYDWRTEPEIPCQCYLDKSSIT